MGLKNYIKRKIRAVVGEKQGSAIKAIPVSTPFAEGSIDLVEVEPIGMLRIYGVSRECLTYPELTVAVNQRNIVEHSRYEVITPSEQAETANRFCLEYFIGDTTGQTNSKEIHVFLGKTLLVKFSMTFRQPWYDFILNTQDVLERKNLYRSSESPPLVVSEDILGMIKKHAQGSVLDFGCGTGVYIQGLRNCGFEAFGIDLDIEWIRLHLRPDSKPYIKLYQGDFPTEYADSSFQTVICIEALEHIPNYTACIEELHRIAQKRVIITVPDIEAIPICGQHDTVPWHLLEAQHINFFTRKSLHQALKTQFESVQFVKIHPRRINGSVFYQTLCAICDK